MAFAESSPDAAATINAEDNSSCEFYTKELEEDPDSRTILCQIKLHCEGFEATWSDEEATMENDYLVQQFLRKNPGTSLADFEKGMYGTSPTILGGIWSHNDSNVSFVAVFDACGNIREYGYSPPESDHTTYAEYPPDDHHHEKVQAFEEERYDLAKTIMGRHPSPKVQVNEFNIPSDRIHCNEGLELFERNNSVPICIKPQTFEKLVERGLDIRPLA